MRKDYLGETAGRITTGEEAPQPMTVKGEKRHSFRFHRLWAALLSFVLVTTGVTGKAPMSAEASYVNTNMNTFVHDAADMQTGYPGQDMQIHVRIGYNGVNGLYNPATDEIRNVRVRLSNDQSYLSVNQPGTTHKSNPYKNDTGEDGEDSKQKDAWEEGYQSGKSNALKNGMNYAYPVDGGVYPFEINASLFTQEQTAAVLKKGEYLDLTFNVTVRSDALTMKDNAGKTSDGYFGVPFTIWYDVPANSTGAQGSFVKTEFVNVFIAPSGDISNPGTQTKDQAFVIGENQETPSGVYPNVMNYGVNLRNRSGRPVYDVKVTLDTNLAEKSAVQLTESAKSQASKDFPFNINEANYDRNYERVEAGESISVPYSMSIKQNAATGYYPLHYRVSYKRAPGANVSVTEDYTFFVNIRNSGMIDSSSTKGEFNENDRTKARIIVDSYATEPEKVYAGEPFKLVLNMKNASSSINASNILFSLSSAKVSDTPVFNMEGGANSVVVNSLAAGETTTLSFQLEAAAGVDPKSYPITVEEKYDSPEFKNASEKVDINIPIYQNARLSASNFEVTPESIEVGSESNVTFGINNTGKVILYNVEAVFEAPSIKKISTYVGNIEPGKTGNVDVTLSGMAATEDEGKIPVTIRYEDVNGSPFEEKTEVTLYVTEPVETDPEMEEPGMQEKPDGSLGLIQKAAILVAIAAALAASVLTIRKRRQRKQRENERNDETI